MPFATMSRLLLASLVAAPFMIACSAASQDGPASSVADLNGDAQTTDGAAPDAGGDSDSHADAMAHSGGEFVDARDNQSYMTKRFGTQMWFARNLNFPIAGSSFCYDDLAQNCDEHGRLYTWSVARKACPAGAHLPTDAEWKDLEVAVGMPPSDLDLEGYDTARGSDEGTTLKASTGFGARMSGFRTGTTYDALGDRTYFWTATTRGAEVWRRRIASSETTVFRFTNPPQGFAISVRCVVD
jgi:uncharacterized protein (TIGR02145 family)